MKNARRITGIAVLASVVAAGAVWAAGPGQGGIGGDCQHMRSERMQMHEGRMGMPGGDMGMRGERPSFKELDANGDGQVSQDELTASFGARFKAADADGDGKLTLDEMRAEAMKRMDEMVAARMKQMDANGDGVLSLDEMPMPPMADRMFGMIDADNSGGISEQEFADAQERMKMRHGGDHWQKQRGKDKN